MNQSLLLICFYKLIKILNRILFCVNNNTWYNIKCSLKKFTKKINQK